MYLIYKQPLITVSFSIFLEKYQKQITKLHKQFIQRKEKLEQLKHGEIQDRRDMSNMQHMKNSYGKEDYQAYSKCLKRILNILLDDITNILLLCN